MNYDVSRVYKVKSLMQVGRYEMCVCFATHFFQENIRDCMKELCKAVVGSYTVTPFILPYTYLGTRTCVPI